MAAPGKEGEPFREVPFTPELGAQYLGQLERACRLASYLALNLKSDHDIIGLPMDPNNPELFPANREVQKLAERRMYNRIDDLTNQGMGQAAWDIVYRYFEPRDNAVPG